MSIPLLHLRNVSLSFGGKPIFEGLSMQLAKGDRVCLVGKNGSGKSTLLKVMSGLIEIDKGEYYLDPKVKVGYLPQTITFPEGITIYDYVLDGIEEAEEEDRASKRYLADIILNSLKLDGKRLVERLSGGKLRRASLARTLVGTPPILLLDEPTNHLDIESIEWLEEYIRSYEGAVLCISHDRQFLSAISNTTLWLDRGKLRLNKKGFADFDRWCQEVTDQESLALSKLSKKVDEENLWLQQGVTARRKRNQGRLSALFDLRQKLKHDNSAMSHLAGTVKLPPMTSGNASKLMVELDSVGYFFPGFSPSKPMIKSFSMRIMKGEKIGIVGANGAGKTTFLRLLVGDLKPTSGVVTMGVNVTISYFDQKRESLDPDRTLWETLCPSGGDIVQVGNTTRHVVAYLKDFLFDQKQIHAKVSSLSGGEANRLLLAKILANPGSLLILDEPTNDLDIETLDMLQEILSDYPGTLLIVSHDRDFIERIVTRTIVFPGGGRIEDYIGGYHDYLSSKNAQSLSSYNKKIAARPQVSVPVNDKPKPMSYKFKRELELLPAEIDKLISDIKAMELKLADPDFYLQQPEQFASMAKSLESKRIELQESEERWLYLQEMAEGK